MRRSRITYKGAYHHVMNRGIKGEDIFYSNKLKDYFSKILEEKSKGLKIKLLAYCVMDNHYHLILQNSSGMMSDFVKQLNGQYGIYYRKIEGGKGYVFQSRFKSTLIQEDAYLDISIIYVLLNPVRAGIVDEANKYRWSSIGKYFKGEGSELVDNEIVEELFKSKMGMNKLLKDWYEKDLPIKKTILGEVLGDDEFLDKAMKKFDRRKEESKSERKRKDDYIFEPVEKVIKGFEKDKGVSVEGININSRRGKNLRDELLLLMKDKSGLKYTEIIGYPPFKSLKYSSLSHLYKRAKNRIK